MNNFENVINQRRLKMRYKEFNRNKALESCITLFWKNGFNSCSINDIVHKTGINRFSLYKEFEHKEGILYSALELYSERYSSKKLEILNQSSPLRLVLIEFYKSFLFESDIHPPGCFIINIATELADSNQKVKVVLENYVTAMEARLVSILQNHPETNSKSLFFAKQLTGLFCNSMCFCVIQTPEERLAHVQNGINIILKENKDYVTYA